MCIAILSEHGVGYPTKDILKRCYRSNSDGVGYAFLTEEDKWCVKKGMQTWASFWESWKAEAFQPEHTVIIHFRVGTSGKKNGMVCSPDCTHPFPVTDQTDDLMKHEYIVDNIIMHNGVVGKGEGDLSDTQVAIRNYANTLIPYYKDDIKIRILLEDLLDAKPSVPNSSRWWLGMGRDYYLLGNWIKDKETQIWYSNDGYLPAVDVWASWTNTLKEYSRATPVEVILLPTYEAVQYMSACVWDWDKWEKDLSTDNVPQKALVVIPDDTTIDTYISPPSISKEITEIFDDTGNIMGMVDKDGDVIWDNDVISTVETSINPDLWERGTRCSQCGYSVEGLDYNEGVCPWCSKNVKDLTEEDNIVCPSCGEKNHLFETQFDVGDTECYRCGAIFMAEVPGQKSIKDWNQETLEAHLEKTCRIMGNLK